VTRRQPALFYILYLMDFEDKLAGRLSSTRRRPGITAVGIFLFFGATMSALAGATLIWHRTPLEGVWKLNPRAYRLLSPHGATVGPLFLLLSTTMVAAGVGWFRGRYWGWVLAVAIVTSQVLGDLVNLLRGDFVRGSIGFAIAGALLMYLLSSKVRSFFATTQSASP